jgi:hypothetical protein
MKLAWMISSFREKTMNVRDNKTGRFADEERAKTDKDNVTVETQKPIDMMLFCPVCKTQHIDEADQSANWDNPPHKSHLCGECGTVWRPADVPTNGVYWVKTYGKNDTWVKGFPRQPKGQNVR